MLCCSIHTRFKFISLLLLFLTGAGCSLLGLKHSLKMDLFDQMEKSCLEINIAGIKVFHLYDSLLALDILWLCWLLLFIFKRKCVLLQPFFQFLSLGVSSSKIILNKNVLYLFILILCSSWGFWDCSIIWNGLLSLMSMKNHAFWSDRLIGNMLFKMHCSS